MGQILDPGGRDCPTLPICTLASKCRFLNRITTFGTPRAPVAPSFFGSKAAPDVPIGGTDAPRLPSREAEYGPHVVVAEGLFPQELPEETLGRGRSAAP